MSGNEVNLRHFLALASISDCGRLSEAAERVYMSQSALTQALHKLEAKAGAQLFERSGYGVVTTEAGKCLTERSRRAAEFLERAAREMRGRHSDFAGLRQNITSGQLRALVSVVDTGGYSMAARRLNLSQPTVHRAAKELESTIGVSLFRRAARGIEPTATAKVLARYAELVFAEIRQGFEEVRELQGDMHGRIAVGCLPLARSEFLPAAITQLLSNYPEARISILDGPYIEQLHALRYGQIDWLIGALRDPPPASDVVEETLFEQSLAVVVRPGHPLLATTPTQPDELAQLEWIAPHAMSPTRQLFAAFLKKHDIAMPSRIIECGSLIASCGIVQQSDCAALLSPMQIRQFVDSGQLAVLIDSLPGATRAIGITTRDNWQPTMLQNRFTEIIRQLAQHA